MSDHRRITKWGSIAANKRGPDGTVASKFGESPDCATVSIGFGLDQVQIEIETDIDYRVRRLERALDLAFKAGDLAARADIRKALGVTEPRL